MPHVSGLFVYPIKSCGGVELTEATVGGRGILHDREFMIVDSVLRTMCTQREYPRLSLIRTGLNDDELVMEVPGIATEVFSFTGTTDRFEKMVSVWDDEVSAFDQGQRIGGILSAFLGAHVRLVRMNPQYLRQARLGKSGLAFADGYPFLGIANASLVDLNRRMKNGLPMNRFRPNITFAGTEPFAEDHWRVSKIGDVRLIGETLCARCVIPTTDQATGERGKEPNTTLAKFRMIKHIGESWKTPYKNKVYFGRNLGHQGEGVIETGMQIEVQETD